MSAYEAANWTQAIDLLEQVVAAVMARFGRLDILINNAAKQIWVSLLKTREDGWDKIFDVNVEISINRLTSTSRKTKNQSLISFHG